METKRLIISRVFICCSNIIFLMSGVAFMILGLLLLTDDQRILLSHLLGNSNVTYQSLFYYVAIALIILGFLIVITAFLGCCVASIFKRNIMVSYLIMTVVLMVSECIVCMIALLRPNVLGIDVRAGHLIRVLQRSYTVPGNEQFTAALDLAQTKFNCCGINGSSNYGTSWWRLQEVGRRELVVPLTCCILNNTNETNSFLNPKPANLTLCQALNPAEHQYARHTEGCLEYLEKWAHTQLLTLLIIMLGIMSVEIVILFCILHFCVRGKRISNAKLSKCTSTQTLSPYASNFKIDTSAEMTFGAKL